MQHHIGSQPLTPVFMSVCPTCDKVFTRENAFNRHVSYCRRAQTRRKGRPRSCLACNSSKTKCSFTTPQCARCEHKGLDCVYYGVQNAPPSLPLDPDVRNKRSCRPDSAPECHQAATPDPDSWLQGLSDDSFPRLTDVDLRIDNTGLGPLNSCIDSIVGWDAGAWSRPVTDFKIPLVPQLGYPTPRTASDSLVPRPGATCSLASLPYETTASRHAANLIARIVSAFPRMMLRRHTFPPFIHAHWHLDAVPEKLASCMRIAEMFVSRTPESRAFLWRIIEAEAKYLNDERYNFSMEELQQGTQAMTIYIVMAIIDQDENTPARGTWLMQACLALKAQFIVLMDKGPAVAVIEADNPSATWEDWIFAESHRRMGCLWFAMTRVFAVKTDRVTCANLDDVLGLPLSSAKSLWEARSRQEWEAEKAFDYSGYPLDTFGELVAAHRQPRNAANALKLDSWQAGADKLGVMMDIAIELVGC